MFKSLRNVALCALLVGSFAGTAFAKKAKCTDEEKAANGGKCPRKGKAKKAAADAAAPAAATEAPAPAPAPAK